MHSSLASTAFQLSAVFEQYYEKGESYSAQRVNYDFPIDQMGVGPANDMTNGGSEAELGRVHGLDRLSIITTTSIM